jgi:hypothetical protein
MMRCEVGVDSSNFVQLTHHAYVGSRPYSGVNSVILSLAFSPYASPLEAKREDPSK